MIYFQAGRDRSVLCFVDDAVGELESRLAVAAGADLAVPAECFGSLEDQAWRAVSAIRLDAAGDDSLVRWARASTTMALRRLSPMPAHAATRSPAGVGVVMSATGPSQMISPSDAETARAIDLPTPAHSTEVIVHWRAR